MKSTSTIFITLYSIDKHLSLMSMDADLSMYPILIPPASNTFHYCHHPQPHHSQPYHAQSIIYLLGHIC